MKTITLEEPGRFVFSETPPPEAPGAGDALVQVRRIGICGTDLHAFRGRQPFFNYPRILGHELGVEIVEIDPNDRGLKAGDRCAVEPYLNCGHCIACRRGKTNCCVHLQVLGVHIDGGMREFITVPVGKLHRSDVLPLEALALVEMLCIGAHAVRRARPEPGERALVIGAGPIGLSVIRFAQLAGAHVLAMDLRGDRLSFCRTQLGVPHTIDARTDAEAELRAVLGGDLPTVVFDATGHAGSMMKAFDLVAHGGKLVYVGLFQGDVTFHDPYFHSHELTLMSSRNATGEDFTHVIRTLEAGRLNLEPWITHRAPFDDMIEAFPTWLQPDAQVVKAEVEFA